MHHFQQSQHWEREERHQSFGENIGRAAAYVAMGEIAGVSGAEYYQSAMYHHHHMGRMNYGREQMYLPPMEGYGPPPPYQRPPEAYYPQQQQYNYPQQLEFSNPYQNQRNYYGGGDPNNGYERPCPPQQQEQYPPHHPQHHSRHGHHENHGHQNNDRYSIYTYDGAIRSNPQEAMASARVVAHIAKEMGVDPVTAVAAMLVESGGNCRAVGDHGNSFGLFQLNRRGELGQHHLTPEQAFDPETNARVASSYFRRGHCSNPGAMAAAAQRPADRADYARKVNSNMAEAARMCQEMGLA